MVWIDNLIEEICPKVSSATFFSVENGIGRVYQKLIFHTQLISKLPIILDGLKWRIATCRTIFKTKFSAQNVDPEP